jgi:hypothetical protein
MNDVMKYTKERSAELAEYLECVSATPLSFEGEDPLSHSAENHVHLWKLEYLADSHSWINTTYRVEFIKHVLEQWRLRLKGLRHYRERGYRLYVYEDMAPTVSVVAETDIGFPYGHRSAVFVPNILDVVKLYENRSWKENFGGLDWEISHEKVIKVVERNKGSIGKPTANALGMQVGKLRSLITNMGLGTEVNEMRKLYRRRPADFSKEPTYFGEWHVFERVLPANYR